DGLNQVAQVYRSPAPEVHRNETLRYFRKTPDRSQTMEGVSDLYLYFIASSRMTRIHQRNIDGVEVLQTIETVGGERNVLRVRADLFVDQFYFSNHSRPPELNERARDLDAYRQADSRRRWEVVRAARYNRLYRQKQEEILRENYPRDEWKYYDIEIRGDITDPNAALTVIHHLSMLGRIRSQQQFLRENRINMDDIFGGSE
ncbi:MAG: hypothetical protein MJK18_15000, partial [Bdellovibrionales bacterium]|nr:hypothetical protein [Bdellovibrionales bacterium]